ncbi:AbrB family transcriptional regulator [Pseudomonas fitomaticsae]|uniref:AbrB family transcriptional regulator n=1 Tax=Pseudomonas fitomaticsae TaxID=2837969 RepID=A0ABY3PY00_9PSED|nr:AbrB family transcriptional regulator [Pseudomonas fitomaticsae]UFP98731.1 AbrB family transcriptional regulator [Pseudomonas fitomaticsae]
MKTVFTSMRLWWATPVVGIAGALIASSLNWPLPWIIGSMLAVILVRCLGWRVGEIPYGRLTGQWMIATSIGLHFTPVVLEQIVGHFAMMLFAAFLTLCLALLGIEFMRHRGMDLTTAFFAFMPANFSEMIQLGIRHKANVSQIAAAHSVRLVLIVLCVPPAMFFTARISPTAVHARLPSDWYWLLPLLIGGALTAMIWKRCKLPNPWMFGPMALCALFTASFNLQTALPVQLSHYGQLMIGCALGGYFDRQFFRASPTFLLKVSLFTLAMIGCTLVLALGIGYWLGFPVMTLALGMMPGSSTEMYLTAEALNLGVGIVTAMQIMRLVVVMLCAEPVHKAWLKHLRR